MKKVLIITYYWPPAGGSGVRRWLYFSKYFPEYGWHPVVLKPVGAEYPSFDPELNSDVHPDTTILEVPIMEPYNLYKKLVGVKNSKVKPGVLFHGRKPGIREKLGVWLRSNLFIPDAKMLWIKPSCRFLSKYLKKNGVDLIISTGPPHTTHLIARKIARKFDIPWIADFRDPWTKIDFFHKLMLTRIGLKKHKRLEKQVLTDSTLQTTVSWSWKEDFISLGAGNVHVVTNGYDPENYSNLTIDIDAKFSITHLGSMNEDRNQSEFWNAISELISEDSRFRERVLIRLVGDIVPAVDDDLRKYDLVSYCEHIPFLSHKDAIQVIANSRILYLPLNRTPHVAGIVPGKIFEYLAVQRPVFAIGPPDGDLAKILETASNGIICNFGDITGMKASLKLLFERYLNETDRIENDDFKLFSREKLTSQMVHLMESITG